MNKDKKILFIEVCNYSDYPIGGYLAFAKQMLIAFGNQLALVGMVHDDTPLGEWSKKEINGITYDFFAVRKTVKTNRKSIIPERIKSYYAIRKNRKKIFSRNYDNVFIQTPEVLFALESESIKNLCTRIPGLENPLSVSRYKYSKFFAFIFDYYFFRKLKKAKLVLASADKIAIQNFIRRGKNILLEDQVIQFPTRVNTKIFYPSSQEEARKILKFSTSIKIVVTTGRLSELKGWKLMVDSFKIFLEIYPFSKFIFLGDGEEREKIEKYILANGLIDYVSIKGRLEHNELSLYLKAADIFIMASYVEGWATSLVEAVACGKPIVCTNFSSAQELVKQEFNGFIIEARNEKLFAEAMIKSLSIPKENLLKSYYEIEKYDSSKLRDDILKLWPLI